MTNPHLLRLFFLFIVCSNTLATAQKYTFNRPKMGSPFIITAYAADSAKLLTVIDLAYRRVDTLNQIFSDYLATSEINLLCKNQKPRVWQPISDDLFHVLELSKKAFDDSHGAYDVTIAPVVRLWRKARKEKVLPDEKNLKTALSKVGFNKIELDSSYLYSNENGFRISLRKIPSIFLRLGFNFIEFEQNLRKIPSIFLRCIKTRQSDNHFHCSLEVDSSRFEPPKKAKMRFYTEGASFDFGGIVKGFAAQEVVNLLTINGFPICFADAGGDLAMGASPIIEGQKTSGWRVGVSVPNSENQLMPQFLFLHHQAVATSGDLYQSVTINGKTYSHIVNPKTGLGLTHRRNVTVIAPDGAQADWLATACSVLPIKKALKLVKKYPNVELLIMENRKDKIKHWESSGFSKYFSEY